MAPINFRAALALTCAAITLTTCAEQTAAQAIAQDRVSYGVLKVAPPAQLTITIHKTPHFCLHTDLPNDQATQALEDMEGALNFAVRYWGQKLRGQIACYLAKNVAMWPEEALPHPLARIWIGGIGGATMSNSPSGHHPSRFQAVIYASTLPGVLPHEVIHAYCSQTFGATGPDWYKEGMAEVAAHHVADPTGTWLPDYLLANLEKSAPRSVDAIVRGANFTDNTAKSLGVMLANRVDSNRPVLLRHWNADATKELKQMQPSYASSWALCHLLANSPNYSAHFRRLGTRYLVQKQDNFGRMFDPVMDELNFEFKHFLKNIANGYRVDLCAWDWKKSFKSIEGQRSITRRVAAARGFQPTGLWVEAGVSYSFSSSGTWSTGLEQTPTDANGTSSGQGRLTGVVFHDFQLSDPIDLGIEGTFTAPVSGKLFVRCNDAWNELADNSGHVHVTLAR